MYICLRTLRSLVKSSQHWIGRRGYSIKSANLAAISGSMVLAFGCCVRIADSANDVMRSTLEV